MSEYNKLVRDGIPDIIKENGEKPVYNVPYTAEEQEYEEALAHKLEEEVSEFLANPSVQEAADVLEVIQTICDLKGIDISKLEEIRQKKAAKRGGFKKRIILDRTEKE